MAQLSIESSGYKSSLFYREVFPYAHSTVEANLLTPLILFYGGFFRHWFHVPGVGSCPKLPFRDMGDLAVQGNGSSDGRGSGEDGVTSDLSLPSSFTRFLVPY